MTPTKRLKTIAFLATPLTLAMGVWNPIDATPETSQKPLTKSAPKVASKPVAPSADIWQGSENSLVARAIGAAEGTRYPAGDKTPAYYGHKDPGNGVWNQGSFSYQHGARTPEEADQKQLTRLQKQDQVLQQKAKRLGIDYGNPNIRLNALDLANQAPLAALANDGGGFLDRLKQAKDMGMKGSDAVLWARVRSYLDPDTGRWNAPGLGNTVDQIAYDQERRMSMVQKAIECEANIKCKASKKQKSAGSGSAALNPYKLGTIEYKWFLWGQWDKSQGLAPATSDPNYQQGYASI